MIPFTLYMFIVEEYLRVGDGLWSVQTVNFDNGKEFFFNRRVIFSAEIRVREQMAIDLLFYDKTELNRDNFNGLC